MKYAITFFIVLLFTLEADARPTRDQVHSVCDYTTGFAEAAMLNRQDGISKQQTINTVREKVGVDDPYGEYLERIVDQVYATPIDQTASERAQTVIDFKAFIHQDCLNAFMPK